MVKLRLTRMGATKAPFYRIVAMDSRKARDGKYIDQIGFYNPVSEPKQIVIDAKNKAKSEYDKIIQKANDDVSKMKETAKKQIAAENEHALHNSKEEIARLAMEVAQKVIEDKAGEELDSEIYNKFLNESSENDDK